MSPSPEVGGSGEPLNMGRKLQNTCSLGKKKGELDEAGSLISHFQRFPFPIVLVSDFLLLLPVAELSLLISQERDKSRSTNTAQKISISGRTHCAEAGAAMAAAAAQRHACVRPDRAGGKRNPRDIFTRYFPFPSILMALEARKNLLA